MVKPVLNNDVENIVGHIHEINDIGIRSQLLVNEELSLLQEDVTRIKSIINDSIHVIQESFNQLQKNISVLDIENNRRTEINHSCLGDNIHHSMNEIIRALQFEDIVSQIADRSAEHIADIRRMVELFAKLHEYELKEGFNEKVEEINQELSTIKERLTVMSTRTIVAQKDVDEGDITLF